MSNPLKVTAALLNSAKGVKLNHYIEEINKVAGKRLLTKQGNIDEQRKQIATHFGIDLGVTVPTESVTGPVNIDEKEWADTEATGQTFKLWPNSNTLLMPDDKAKLATLLPDTSLAHFNSMDCDRDHLQALIGSAEDGDQTSQDPIQNTAFLALFYHNHESVHGYLLGSRSIGT
ncbi:hypothetical protein K439DRAFT_1619839 [Ramaria rubella]|nr:hypothetical protein K439DRAFT_1619839 [Ramaria rubella]